jgi:hypothetical protein
MKTCSEVWRLAMKTLPLFVILRTAACAHPNAVAPKLASLCPDGVKVFYAPSEVGKEYEQVQWLRRVREPTTGRG